MKIVARPKDFIAAVSRTLPSKDSVVEIRAGAHCTISVSGSEAGSEFVSEETLPLAQCVEGGSVTVNAREFLRVLRSLDGCADTVFELNSGVLKVSQGAMVLTLPEVSRTDVSVTLFTGVDRAAAALLYGVNDVSAFRAVLDSAMHLTSGDELRRALMGIFFAVSDEGKRSLVATDTHRVCVLPVPAGEGDFASAFPVVKSGFEERGVHFPYPFARRLQKTLASYGSRAKILSIRYAGDQVEAEVIRSDGAVFVLTAVFVQGDFPYWPRVIPNSAGLERRVIATLDEGAIANACYHLDRYAASSRKVIGARVLLWNDSGYELHIEGVNESATMVVSVPSTPWQFGRPDVISVNPEYLVQCLKAALGTGSAAVQVEIGRTLDPLTLRGSGGVVVLMPMLLPEGPMTGYSRSIDTVAAEVLPVPEVREVSLMV